MVAVTTHGLIPFLALALASCSQCDSPTVAERHGGVPDVAIDRPEIHKPCAQLQEDLCSKPCGQRVVQALASATPDQCRRWTTSAELEGVLGRADRLQVPPACQRLVETACEIAPTLCGDMRSVLPLGGGTIREGEHCERIISSPHLMAQLARRLSRIAFAADQYRNGARTDDP